MRHEDIWDEEAARTYDTPGVGMFAPNLIQATVDRLVELAAGGSALEFAIGTGRVAVPLSQRGVPVSGIEMSPAMVAELRRKADDRAILVVIGDMATASVLGQFSLVFLVYNGISNLLTQAGQLECFRNAARHLKPGGRFVIENGVPGIRRMPPGQEAVLARAEPGYILVDTYDQAGQILVSHHFRFGEGKQATVFRSAHRYAWPAELDMMARLAGFDLECRHADWTVGAFTGESDSHVSVYRLRSGEH